MARIARYANEEIEVARRMASGARATQQLRQSQVILLPALTGATMETTAEVLGLSRDRVCVLRRQFRAAGNGVEPVIERRGGRRRELMALDEEKAFLSPWLLGTRAIAPDGQSRFCARVPLCLCRDWAAGGNIALDGGRSHEYRNDGPLSAASGASASRCACAYGA